MNTSEAMRALIDGATTAVSAPMSGRGTVVITRRHGDSCPFTVTKDIGETKRTYKFRKIATAFQRARENSGTNMEWTAAA
jgi:hypothetical protein